MSRPTTDPVTSGAARRRVDVVTLLWRNEAHAHRFLSSLTASAAEAGASLELIAVQNGPDGARAAQALRTAPDTEWVRVSVAELPTNVGFAGGANHGCDLTDADVIVLANLDMVFDQQFVTALLARAPTMHRPGFLAPSVVTVRGTVEEQLGALRRGPFHELRALDAVPAPGQQVPAGNGCCLVFDRGTHLLRKAANGALFDPEYHSYYEDLDLFWWAERAGVPFHFAPEMHVEHVQGGSFSGKYRFADRSGEVRCSVMANYRLTIWKHASTPGEVLRWLVGEAGYLVRSIQVDGLAQGCAGYTASWRLARRRVLAIRARRGRVRPAELPSRPVRP